ncbi:hydroxymethylbilane synthase [Terrilactibacillus sp. BCM23-1]|uniref:Porphobilinogen deaminase n=1 Tax=Terrilactibacillus tamarindi TaxID=2599694 RepID=A0A6N8CQ14_9BACI|nr:hydroxymethylbilane synthase [Terrilactibacillus tamarindi]MTT31730.1 hydroxymethylbilane synthase [Terrilactibacillus tamarindi]
MRNIHVGSRKSKLALTQTEWVIDQLKKTSVGFTYSVEHIVTKGDRILDVTLSKVGGKGLFVKEIETALLNKDIDFAVHSMKDMPSELPPGLKLACIPVREDCRDALISNDHIGFRDLKEGAVIGTSSLRRAAQVLHERPDLTIRSLRGNIDTRLRKLKEDGYDAIILAAAGLNRMGWSQEVVTEYLSDDLSVPAVGQGALAIECREDDYELIEVLKEIHDKQTAATVGAERAFLRKLNGGCQVPIAAHCTEKDGIYTLTGLVGSPDGKTVLKESVKGKNPESIGLKLADLLLAQGAEKLIAPFREGY